MDDLRHTEVSNEPLPNTICVKIAEEIDVWCCRNCRCGRSGCQVVAHSAEEMIATTGDGDYSDHTKYQSFVMGKFKIVFYFKF